MTSTRHCCGHSSSHLGFRSAMYRITLNDKKRENTLNGSRGSIKHHIMLPALVFNKSSYPCDELAYNGFVADVG